MLQFSLKKTARVDIRTYVRMSNTKNIKKNFRKIPSSLKNVDIIVR